jgi:tetratricopeptide (TPR) repeat protein
MTADRHLLFGLLALQTGLIQQAQLVAAFHAWTCDKSRSLADHLIALGYLDTARRAAVEALAALHVDAHGGDVEKSVAALPAGRSARASLAQLDDPDIAGTLAKVGSGSTDRGSEADADADRTPAYSVGTATSDGQRFRVLRPHARGGLGTVFVALDTELHREVAFKQILDVHAQDPTSRQRFVLEAEVTGGLEHPGIVPVYGLGTDANRRPYYAMRFIRGDSLKEAIARFHTDQSLEKQPGQRSLEQRKLLRRFLDVCNTIDYAHSCGVLHRDIKPGNVIVGRYGETLVVDWGLAKATGKADPSSGERTLWPFSASGSAETLPGSALGTPAYMSPEQAAGDLERLGPRSDVYSLGATLYCLLTGEPPHEGDDLGAILRKVERGEFFPPRQLDATIDQALEAICLKAMAQRPVDRYASCRGLAEDIERWMADEPVSAWREPLARRAQRWARRHLPAVTGAAAALLVGLIGLAAAATVFFQQRQVHKNRLELALREVHLLRGQAQADPEGDPVKWHAALQAVRRAEDLLGPLIDAGSEGRVRQLGQQIAAAARARDRDAVLLRDVVDIRSAEADDPDGSTSDAAYARAFRDAGIDVDTLGPAAAAATLQARPLGVALALTTVLDDWASQRRNSRPKDTDAWKRLVATARAADPEPTRDRLRQLWSESDVKTQRQPLLQLVTQADPHVWPPASLMLLAGALAKAGELDAAVDLLRRSQAVLPGDVTINYNLARLLEQLNPPRIDEAIRFYSVARALRPETAHELAHALHSRNRSEEALAVLRDLTERRRENGRHWGCLGKLLKEHGDRSDSVAALEKAVAAHREAIRLKPDLVGAHFYLGNALYAQGNLDEAIGAYREAIRLKPGLSAAHTNLGSVLRYKGKLDEAVAEHREAIRLKPDFAEAHASLGYVLTVQGKRADAIVACREAIRLKPEFADAHYNLGLNLEGQGNLPEAIAEYRAAIRLKPDHAEAHSNLGELLAGQGKLADAIAEFRAAIRHKPDKPEPHANLGLSLRALGDYTDAIAELRKARDLAQSNPRLAQLIDRDLTTTQEQASLAARLPAVLAGKAQPADVAEALGFARLCFEKKLHGASARLWSEAFQSQPTVAGDMQAQNRYNAACAAVLASGAKGEDNPPLDALEKSRWRKQALDWLRADLAFWTKQAEAGKPEANALVGQTLQHWEADSDLAGIRDETELNALSKAERKACRALWTEVDQLLARARAGTASRPRR